MVRQTVVFSDQRVTAGRYSDHMPDPTPRRTVLEGKRILLIEDNKDVQLFVTGIARLERAGLTVARSGEEGLTILLDDPAFDTILLDINLPGISGWEFLRSLREEPPSWTVEPRVFIFTASAANTIQDQAAELRAAGIITKPVSAKELVQALAAAA